MTTETLLTLEEFLALPETTPYTELVDGVPCQKPVGSEKHSRAQGNLYFLLRTHPRIRRGRSRTELGVQFLRTARGNLRVPDVVYYLPENVDRSDSKYPARAPDLAAEVISEGQSRATLRRRLEFLREHGTICTLLIDPEDETVEVYDGESVFTARADEQVTLAGVNGFSFVPRDLFSD